MKMMTTEGEKLAKVVLHYKLVPSIDSSRMKVMCPFHKDLNPSMSVNFNEGFFYCFGCGEKGGPEKFVSLMEAKAGKNSLEQMLEYNRILKGEGKHVDFKMLPEATRSSLRSLYDQAYDTYHGLKTVSWSSPESLEEEMCLDYMEHRGFTAESLAECGAKVTYRENYPLIFPMNDNGVFKGWVCRTTDPIVAKRRKYLYNKGFSRRTTLVGNYGQKLLDGCEAKYVIAVEGFMDRLKFVQFGVKNAVALLGWRATGDQILKLKDAGVSTIVSALDNDEYGRKGTRFLEDHFNVVRWQYLKGIKDPGDMDLLSFTKMMRKTKQKLRGVLGKEESK